MLYIIFYFSKERRLITLMAFCPFRGLMQISTNKQLWERESGGVIQLLLLEKEKKKKKKAI